MPNYTKIEDLMDIEEFFDRNDRGLHSMNGIPPQKFNNLQQQVSEENNERTTKIKPLDGKLRTNVNMNRAMNGGSIYPSNPIMHSPPEITNPSYNEYDQVIDANNYRLGPKAYPLRNPGNNSYSQLVEGYKEHYKEQLNCIDVSNHIKNCPICSKFYENDKSIYIIIIIILAIVCIILARKVLENYEK
jgi:hypothetical protein